jgi:hypothetical protein
MRVSKMLGATMVAGALATGGAVAGIAGAAAAPSGTSTTGTTGTTTTPSTTTTTTPTTPTTPSTPSPTQKSGTPPKSGSPGKHPCPNMGSGSSSSGSSSGAGSGSFGLTRRVAGQLARRAADPTSDAQPVALASRPSDPDSVWLVAAAISTWVSSPGAARPEKLTTLL